MTPNQRAIEQRAFDLIQEGNNIWKTGVVVEYIKWNRAGRAAGMAGIDKDGKYYLVFSKELAEREFDTIMKDTVPHEVAHLITFYMNRQGRSKDRGHGVVWRRVCLSLGGTGKRCHNMEVTPMRNRRKYRYEYRMPSGITLMVGPKYHNQIQLNNRPLHVRSTGERVAAYCYTGKKVVL